MKKNNIQRAAALLKNSIPSKQSGYQDGIGPIKFGLDPANS